ncbi:uncharacterized protein [Cicer arietinum]|uniref:uncharacterized protein n=1 Tax=Cicer arietinum TaxID=3827 RepID=UPI003CC547E9
MATGLWDFVAAFAATKDNGPMHLWQPGRQEMATGLWDFVAAFAATKGNGAMHGFRPNYWIWTNHGEGSPTSPSTSIRVENNIVPSSSTNKFGVDYNNYQHFWAMNDMILDVVRVNLLFSEDQYDDTGGFLNEEAHRFYGLLTETNKSLFERSLNSKFSMCIRLLGLKFEFHVLDLTLDLMTKMMLDATHIRDGLPQSYYDAKWLVSKLGLGVKMIDFYVKGCMLYYDNEFGINDTNLVECMFFQQPRYRQRNNSRVRRGKYIPRKAMFYLPIVSRLKKMLASMQTARKMTWHYENRRNQSCDIHLMFRIGTHAKLACPIDMEDTKEFILKFCGKASWFDLHHRLSSVDHAFRWKKTAFIKGYAENLAPPLKLTL